MLMMRPQRRTIIPRATRRMHRKNFFPAGAVHEHEQAVVGEPGVVDENIYRSELFLDAVEKSADLALVADVTLPAEAASHRGQIRLDFACGRAILEKVERHRSALGSERDRYRPAYSAASAGHDSNQAFERTVND